MCDPLTLGGIALSAGSMLVNNMAESRVAKAREGAMTAESIRQRKLDQEAEALNAASRNQYKDFGEQQDAKAADVAEFFRQQNQAIPQTEAAPTETMPSSASNIVVQEQKKQAAKAKAYGDQQADAMGALRSFGDLLGDTSRVQARNAADIGTIGGFKRGSSAILPLELEAANQKGAGLRLFGDLLSGAGGVATSAGLSKGGYDIFGLGGASNVQSTPFVQRTIKSPSIQGATYLTY